MNGVRWALPLSGALLCGACSSPPTPLQRLYDAQRQAAAHGWQATTLHAGRFEVMSWAARARTQAALLTIYIEGDGLAWLNRHTSSPDPTPVNPVALNMALAQQGGTVAYLARPCQFQRSAAPECTPQFWTDGRFAPVIVEAMNQAVNQLKARYGASQLVLVGYSGGAAISGLLAATRNDVVRWVTVAGNLDPDAWSRYHRVQPLTNPANPANYRARLATVAQWHFVGGQDSVVPPFIARDFTAGMTKATVIEEPTFTHQCCWAEQWRRLSAGVVSGAGTD